MTRAELVTSAAEALQGAALVVAAVEAQSYATVGDFETAANAVREDLATLIPLIDAAWGVDATDVLLGLQRVGARLLDLRGQVLDSRTVLSEAPPRVTSALELAFQAYGDATRFAEICDLNPTAPHPGFLRAGREVLRYA